MNEYNDEKRGYDYEDAYDSAMREVRRLRGIVQDYSKFYNKIKEALEEQDWEKIKAAIAWLDE